MIHNIVVGTDGSQTAAKAVKEAAELAARVGAAVEIVAAYTRSPDQRHREAAREAQHLARPRDGVDATLQEAKATMEELGIRDVNVYAREGDAADAIMDVAEEQSADLIVVGNKGMSDVKRFVLGSVPNRISHHAPCSVLIVRTT